MELLLEKFSSPFRGFYLSTLYEPYEEKADVRSRPLFGVSIFLRDKQWRISVKITVLVPFSGFLSFYDMKIGV